MVYGKLSESANLLASDGIFRKALSFLRDTPVALLPPGKLRMGENVTVSIQHYDTAYADTLKMEAHNRFFDIQYVARGEEIIEVCDRENLLVSAAYDPEKDIVFYQTPSIVSQIVLHAGDYLILAPDEAHKPRCTVCAPCSVVKAVVKIPVPEGASNK